MNENICIAYFAIEYYKANDGASFAAITDDFKKTYLYD